MTSKNSKRFDDVRPGEALPELAIPITTTLIASAAIWATVVASYPCSRNSCSAASASLRRVRSFLRSRRPICDMTSLYFTQTHFSLSVFFDLRDV